MNLPYSSAYAAHLCYVCVGPPLPHLRSTYVFPAWHLVVVAPDAMTLSSRYWWLTWHVSWWGCVSRGSHCGSPPWSPRPLEAGRVQWEWWTQGRAAGQETQTQTAAITSLKHRKIEWWFMMMMNDDDANANHDNDDDDDANANDDGWWWWPQ